MSNTRPCPSCKSLVEEGDSFCPSCGRAVTPESNAATAGGTACPLCGQMNALTAASCSACGAKIRDIAGGNAEPASRPAATGGIAAFQSWKFTLGVGAILVVALVVLVTSQKAPEAVPAVPAVQGDPHANPMMDRLRELQAHLEKNPKDAAATLEFANILYDVQFFERAAEMYDRYLSMEPGNADARVDLGTSYYQMSLSDSTGRRDLVAKAESCFLKAIETKPGHQFAHFNLGIIHLQMGDMPGARKWLERCVAIDSTSASAQRAKQLMSEHVQIKP
jgi:cytochrome c-type biogenesis protein CcmH/NrfG